MTRQMMRLSMAAALATFALAGSARPAAAEETVMIKIATLAPEGSSWMKNLREWALTTEKHAPGLKVKFYAGGVAGDERDAVRKMRLKQINGAAVTAIGLGLIQPEVRVFELPFLFKNVADLDRVREMLDADVRGKFEEKGYHFLAWGDVGPVHLFSNIPIKSRADLGQVKLWAWVDDPLVRTLFQQMSLNGVPLGVPDVLTSLQTGLINACYGSPLAVLALQWNTKVKYMTSMVLSQSIGAIVMTKDAWDGLKPEWQKVLNEESKRLQDMLRANVRDKDNEAALAKMKQIGLQVVETPAPVVQEFQSEGRKVANKLEGQVYTHAFRERVEQLAAQLK